MNLLFYQVFRYYFTFWLTILYRTFTRINKQNVPAEGPVIIYANHRNLFIDGVVFLLLTKQSITGIDRVVRVITAASRHGRSKTNSSFVRTLKRTQGTSSNELFKVRKKSSNFLILVTFFSEISNFSPFFSNFS